MSSSLKADIRKRRHRTIRKKIVGTASVPRLCVFRSTSHIYVQAIDDTTSSTLVSASSVEKELKGSLEGKNKKDVAFLIGEAVAAKCKAKGIDVVVFDRGGFKYHGRVMALADGARKGGLKF